jgi:SnoaL-like domain
VLNDQDRLAVIELYGRYAHAFDHARARDCAELFTAEATFTTEGRTPITGRDALEEFFTEAATRSPGSRHFTSNIILDGAGPDRLYGSAYVLVLRVTDDSVLLASMGVYRDQFVRTDAGWLIQSRHFLPAIPSALAGAPLVSAGSERA